eukprot:Opistho-1_new@94041
MATQCSFKCSCFISAYTYYHTALCLTKQECIFTDVAVCRYFKAHVLLHSAFYQCYKQSTFCSIVCTVYHFAAYCFQYYVLQGVFFFQIKMWSRAVRNTQYIVQVFRTVDVVAILSYYIYRIAIVLEVHGHLLVQIIQHTHHTDCRRRIYRAIIAALVVEANVATCNRRTQLTTSIAHTAYSVYKLIVYFFIVRVTKVQTVGNSYRQATATYYVTCSLTYSYHATFVRVRVYIAAVTVCSHSNAFCRAMYAYYCSVTRFVCLCIACTYHAVILFVYPAFAGNRWQFHQIHCYSSKVCRYSNCLLIECVDFSKISWFFVFACIHRSTAAQYQTVCGYICYQFFVHVVFQAAVCSYFTYLHTVDVPLVKYLLYFSLASFLHYYQHALLAFAQQHFPCLHIFLTCRYLIQMDDHTMFALSTHLRARAGNTCSAHILHTYQCTCWYHFKAGFQ